MNLEVFTINDHIMEIHAMCSLKCGAGCFTRTWSNLLDTGQKICFVCDFNLNVAECSRQRLIKAKYNPCGLFVF